MSTGTSLREAAVLPNRRVVASSKDTVLLWVREPPAMDPRAPSAGGRLDRTEGRQNPARRGLPWLQAPEDCGADPEQLAGHLVCSRQPASASGGTSDMVG